MLHEIFKTKLDYQHQSTIIYFGSSSIYYCSLHQGYKDDHRGRKRDKSSYHDTKVPLFSIDKSQPMIYIELQLCTVLLLVYLRVYGQVQQLMALQNIICFSYWFPSYTGTFGMETIAYYPFIWLLHGYTRFYLNACTSLNEKKKKKNSWVFYVLWGFQVAATVETGSTSKTLHATSADCGHSPQHFPEFRTVNKLILSSWSHFWADRRNRWWETRSFVIVSSLEMLRDRNSQTLSYTTLASDIEHRAREADVQRPGLIIAVTFQCILYPEARQSSQNHPPATTECRESARNLPEARVALEFSRRREGVHVKGAWCDTVNKHEQQNYPDTGDEAIPGIADIENNIDHQERGEDPGLLHQDVQTWYY